MDQKKQVIYLAGMGHSGTTLLGMLLGAQEGVFNLGEVDGYENDYKENRFCTCGEPVQNCSFWTQIISEYQEITQKSESKYYYDFSKPQEGLDFEERNVYKKWQDRIKGVSIDKIEGSRKKYLRSNNLILTLIAERLGSQFLVDTSKNLTRMAILLKSEKIVVKPVFVVRNAEEIVKGFLKRKPSSFLDKICFSSLKKILGWRNKLRKIRIFIDRNLKDKNFYIITYREFCSNPIITTKKLCQFLGVNFNLDTLERESGEFFLNNPQHLFTGNKLKNSSIDKIKCVSYPSEKLTKVDKAAIKLFKIPRQSLKDYISSNL